MKKLYAFFAAALMSASMFAAAPTAADLAVAYDVVNNVVFCIEFIDEAEVCGDIYFVGTPNNWAKGEGTVELWSNVTEKFAPVPGFDGWYAAEMPYSEGFGGKPVQRQKEATSDNFIWDYQCGDKDAWVHVGGLELGLEDGFAGECNIKFGAAGAYIYQLKYWKLHKSPCAPVVKHTYTVKVYAPDACADMKPAIIGNFNSWKEGVAMQEGLDDNFETVYSYTFEDQEGHGFKIKEVSDTDWSNQMQYLAPEDTDNDTPAKWVDFDNYELGAEETIVLDYSDNSKYRFALCSGEEPEQVYVQFKFPAGAPAAGVEIIGPFDGWKGTALKESKGVYAGIVEATASQFFKFREAGTGTWDNEILLYDDELETPEWRPIKDGELVFGEWWREGSEVDASLEGYKFIGLDLSNPNYFAWKVPSGIEDVTLTEQAQKVLIDGQIYIIRDNKMFNLQGAQVR